MSEHMKSPEADPSRLLEELRTAADIIDELQQEAYGPARYTANRAEEFLDRMEDEYGIQARDPLANVS